ncbi:hypothetical protein KY339_04145 [Candidatus Woesearchaeota archaeon]|nr:hypothetical protein [Candidatus Woesearchaeota archaeon]
MVVSGKLAFAHMVSERRLAIMDKRAARRYVSKMIDVLEDLKEKIPKAINAGNVEETKEGIKEFLGNLGEEEQALYKIAKHAAMQEKVLKDLNEEERKTLGKIQEIIHNPKIEKEEKELEKLSSSINSMITKAARETRDARAGEERVGKYVQMLGYKHLAYQLRKRQRRIKREVRKEAEDDKELHDILRRLQSSEDEGERDKLTAKVVKITEDFAETANREVKDLELVEHNSVILFFNALHDLKYVLDTLKRIADEGFPAAEERELQNIASELRSDMDHNLIQLRNMQRYLK